MHARRRKQALTLLLACATALTAAAALACSAHAGEWVQVSCVNPNGTGAGSQGWVSMIAGGGYGSNTDTSCGPGDPAFAILSDAQAVPVGAAETLHYIPPSGSTLNGGYLQVALFADGGGTNASGTAVAYSPEYIYDGSNVFFQCAWGLTPCSPASHDYSGGLTLPSGRGGELYLSAGCGGTAGYTCNEDGSEGAWSLARLYSATLRLSNDSTPAASGFSGTLLAPDARGAADLAFTASDPEGPGVYSVSVGADGHTLYSGVPDDDEGQCAPVGETAGSLMFDSSQPCRRSESVAMGLDTTALPDGTHTLTVTVTDAAQNSSVVLEQPISTDNAPVATSAPSIGEAEPQPGSMLESKPGGWSDPTGAGPIAYSYRWQQCNGEGAVCTSIRGAEASTFTPGATQVGHTLRAIVTASDSDGTGSLSSPASTVVSAPAATLTQAVPAVTGSLGTPNGNGASEAARLRITGTTRLRRHYTKRGFRLTGELSAPGGEAISGATLDLLEERAGTTTARLIGQASTDGAGSFDTAIPAGPSRRVVVAYRAYAGESYATRASVNETVAAAISLHISPRQTASVGTILLEGTVEGPLPAHGVQVELLVHYRGNWEPFRDARTDARGRFHVRYHFEGALGTFPFRAQVLGEQAGFPYASGASAESYVHTD
jgi:hypothetical protein